VAVAASRLEPGRGARNSRAVSPMRPPVGGEAPSSAMVVACLWDAGCSHRRPSWRFGRCGLSSTVDKADPAGGVRDRAEAVNPAGHGIGR
jgi:hypothetical protein